jgi:hypothetical protein
VLPPLTAEHTRLLADLDGMLGELRIQGKRLFIVLTNPSDVILSPINFLDRTDGSAHRPTKSALDRKQYVAGDAYLIDRIRELALRHGATIIDPIDWLCDDDRCPATTLGGEPIYKDESHLRASFVREHARYIDQVVGF